MHVAYILVQYICTLLYIFNFSKKGYELLNCKWYYTTVHCMYLDMFHEDTVRNGQNCVQQVTHFLFICLFNLVLHGEV
jgi:hypothetical protein